MKLTIVFLIAAITFYTLSGRECQAQTPPCGATSFYLYGNYQNQEVLLHFIGINGSAYSGNPLAYLYTALNFPENAPVGAVVEQVVSANGVPQDGPGTFLASNSAEFTNVLYEALIWAAMDYWYFQFGGQSAMSSDQNNFQQVYQNEWKQELGIDLTYLVDVNNVIQTIADDLATALEDPVAAEQINSLISLFPDIVSGIQTLQASTAPGILAVLEQYNIVTRQNYTSAELIAGLANLDPSNLPLFEASLYAAAYPGDNLHPSAQQYLTDFFQNFGTGLAIRGATATGLGAYDVYQAYATSDLTASSTQAAVSDAGTFLQDGITALAAGAATATIIQNYLLPQSDVLQDMVFLQNSLDQDLFPELTTVSGEMTGNNGFANLDNGPALAADIEVISSFESIWCGLGAQEENNEVIQSQLQQYLALGPAFGGRAANFYNMLVAAHSMSQTVANESAGIPTPVVTGLSQSSGVLGDQITITGSGFCNAVAVYFGNAPASPVTEIPITSTQIVVGVPAGTGTVDVRVVGACGTSQINASDEFFYGTIPPGPATTVISLSGNLAFANEDVSTTATNTFTIINGGSTLLTVTNISVPAGFLGNFSGTIPVGGSTNVAVTFAPTATTTYGGLVTVNSDATSGTDIIDASGTGIIAAGFTFGPLLVSSIGSSSANITFWIYPNGVGCGNIAVYGGPVGGYTNENLLGELFSTTDGETGPIYFGPATASPLSSATPYVIWAQAGEGYDTVTTQPVYFTTLPAGSLPAIQAENFSPVTPSSGQFAATVVPNAQPTVAWFDYTIGSAVYSSPTINISADDAQLVIGPWIASNCPPATTISWQVVASNLWGLTLSPTQSFQTLPLPPSIVSLTITNITSSSASINALLNPNGGDAVFSVFVTNTVTESVSNTPFADIGDGSSPTNFMVQLIGLSPSNAYIGCFVTTNSGGSNFATFQFTSLPIQYAVSASAGNGGSVFPTNITVIAGRSVAFTAATNINYNVQQWLLNGTPEQAGGNAFTLSDIQTNYNVGVTFAYAPTFYGVSGSASNGGSIYPTNVSVLAGSNVTF
ncbi:MAG: hypothetical protein ABR924_16865, partial [Terracidiphilus sp.]